MPFGSRFSGRKTISPTCEHRFYFWKKIFAKGASNAFGQIPLPFTKELKNFRAYIPLLQETDSSIFFTSLQRWR